MGAWIPDDFPADDNERKLERSVSEARRVAVMELAVKLEESEALLKEAVDLLNRVEQSSDIALQLGPPWWRRTYDLLERSRKREQS